MCIILKQQPPSRNWRFQNKIFCCSESTVPALLKKEASNSTEQTFTESPLCTKFEREWYFAKVIWLISLIKFNWESRNMSFNSFPHTEYRAMRSNPEIHQNEDQAKWSMKSLSFLQLFIYSFSRKILFSAMETTKWPQIERQRPNAPVRKDRKDKKQTQFTKDHSSRKVKTTHRWALLARIFSYIPTKSQHTHYLVLEIVSPL